MAKKKRKVGIKGIKKFQRRLFSHRKELAWEHGRLSFLLQDVHDTIESLGAAEKELDAAIKKLDKRASKANL